MSTHTLLSSVGVCVLDAPSPNVPRTVSYAHYIHEILGHAGLFYSTVEPDALRDALSQIRVLITVGETQWPDEMENVLRQWVENGGAWLGVGGAGGMHELFGVHARTPEYTGVAWGGQSATLGEGYLQATDSGHPVLQDATLPLHFFNGLAMIEAGDAKVLARSLDSHQRKDDLVGVVERRVGRGRCLLIAPDAVGSIVRIQQGVAITRDGVPSRDGSGAVTDGVLKCDDGMVLDWDFDRQNVSDAPGLRGFLEPIADLWRGVLLRSIFYLAQQQSTPLALLWLYPRNLPALAHLSHDSDLNEPKLAQSLLDVTAEVGVPASWCVILPGYEPEMIAAIKSGGHELAVHYDAMDNPWGEVEFDSQWKRLCEQFGERPVSNKNHYTRWEGDTEFFEWCEKRGIEIDGSKGPSKWGEGGFNFGTSSPYFPVAPDGRIIDVLEIPFLAQDLEVFLPALVIAPFVSGVLRSHGVMHLLFHPNHIERPNVADALRNAVRAAREAGMEWWTSRRINDWERARRKAQWKRISRGGEYSVALQCPQPLAEATLLFFNPNGANVIVDGDAKESEAVTRWGFDFDAVTLDIEPGHEHIIQIG